MSATTETYLAKRRKYSARHYKANEKVVFKRALGVWLYDVDGNSYVDAMAGYGCVNFGHNHPKILNMGQELYSLGADGLGIVNVVANAYTVVEPADTLEYACRLFGYEKVIATNGGVEGVETALKLMRKYGMKYRGIDPKRSKIVACIGNFHGRTTTVVSFSSTREYRDPFAGPSADAEFILIPYNDADALENVLAKNPDVVGFIVEPIQGEGGVVLPSDGYLKRCYNICKKHDVVFCADEIQTGLGRTGYMLACEHDGVKPDIAVLGKALGVGRSAVAMVFANDKDMCFENGEHGSTYGGCPEAMVKARTALEITVDEDLCRLSTLRGALLRDWLALGLSGGPGSELVREVRGRGLMIGIELVDSSMAGTMVDALLDHGVVTKDAHGVIRVTPPLVIKKEEIETLVGRILSAFHAVSHAQKAPEDCCGKCGD